MEKSLLVALPAEECLVVIAPELRLSCQEKLDVLETSVDQFSRTGSKESQERGCVNTLIVNLDWFMLH